MTEGVSSSYEDGVNITTVSRTSPGNIGGAVLHSDGPNGVLWPARAPVSRPAARILREGARRCRDQPGTVAQDRRSQRGVTRFVTHRCEKVTVL